MKNDGQFPPAEGLSGALIVNKAKGYTSHDVVQIARRALGIRKIGHTGTLDPFATGVLLIAIGSATRLIQLIVHLHYFTMTRFV